MYYNKYIKYKEKYMNLKKQTAGTNMDTLDIHTLYKSTQYLDIRELIKFMRVIFPKNTLPYIRHALIFRETIDFTTIFEITNKLFQQYFISNELKLNAKKVIFKDCNNITIESINMFIKQCPQLEILNIINSGIFFSNNDENQNTFNINRRMYLLENNIKNLCIINTHNIGNDILESIINNSNLINLHLDFNIENNYFDEAFNFNYVFTLLVRIIFNNKNLQNINLPKFIYTTPEEYRLSATILEFIRALLNLTIKLQETDTNLYTLFNIPEPMFVLERNNAMFNATEYINMLNVNELSDNEKSLFNQVKQNLLRKYLHH